MNPLGGHIGSDGDGLGPKQPELFDIHVMIFAGDPESTIAGLARYFLIDRAAAERLVEDVPVVVKRAAEPDVAAEMVDVLGALGAQVVLLPAASAVPSETDLLELKEPSVAPPPMARNASPARSEWGALEPIRQAGGAPARRTATVDMLAEAPMAELELEPTRGAKATLLEARAPTRSAPPGYGPAIDDELVIAPLYEPGEAENRGRAPKRAAPAQAVSLPPARAIAESAPPARAISESLPPALGELLSSVPPPVVHTVPSMPALPDLGLGSVPPLPALAAGPGAPPPVPNAALRGGAGAGRISPPAPLARAPGKPQPPPAPGVVPAPTQQRALYERTLDTDAAAKLPSLGVVPTTGTGPAAARPAAGDNYWSGRRAPVGGAAELGELEPEVAQPQNEPAAPAGGAAPGEAIRGLGARPMVSRVAREDGAAAPRSRGRGFSQVVLGLTVFAFFLQQGDSILLGNADVVSIVLHGLALFAIGSGLAELRG